MTALLRLAEVAVVLFLVAWTVVFPLATLVSLLFTVPLFLLIAPRAVRQRPRRVRA